MAFAELVYFFLKVSTSAQKVLCLTLVQPNTLVWCQAAEAGDDIRSLASYSMLRNIPCIKNLLPGLCKRINEEISILKVNYPKSLVAWWVPMSTALRRAILFSAIEISRTYIGLFRLYHELTEIRYPFRFPFGRSLNSIPSLAFVLRWIPFIGFANHITGIVDQEELRIEAVLRVFFAHNSGDLETSEALAIHNLNGILLRELCRNHGLCKGFGLYLSLTSHDYHRLLVVARTRVYTPRIP